MVTTFRRRFLLAIASATGVLGQQVPQAPRDYPSRTPGAGDNQDDDDVTLPNGKSQKIALAKREHEDALKDVDSLVKLAEELRDELKHSGEFVVSVSSLKKTEEIEKIARRIRTKLKT